MCTKILPALRSSPHSPRASSHNLTLSVPRRVPSFWSWFLILSLTCRCGNGPALEVTNRIVSDKGVHPVVDPKFMFVWSD